MRAATLDQRIAGTSYGWEGERNNSPSVQRVNGSVVRRNLRTRPGAPDGFGAGPGGVVVQSFVADPRFKSDQVRKFTWTTVPTGPWAYPSLVQAVAVVAGEVYAISVRYTPTFPDGPNPFQVAGANPPAFTVSDFSLVDNGDGTVTRSGILTITATNGAHLGVLFYIGAHNGANGDSMLIGDICLEKTNVVRPYFDGDSVVTSETINGVTPPRRSDTRSHLRSARLDPSQWRWAA